MTRIHQDNAKIGRILVVSIAAVASLLLMAGKASAMDYQYDSLNRLVKVVYDDGTVVGYTYDLFGNRLRKEVIRPVSPPALVVSEPTPDGTLPRTQHNGIRLIFDGAIDANALPAVPVSIVPIGGGEDVGGQFAFGLEASDANDPNTANRVLTCVEQGSVLADRTWYRIRPASGFGVQPFSLDVCTLRGDANGDGVVLANDYNVVKVHIGEASSWSRADLNGDGMVLANDYNVVKVHIGNEAPAKAGGGGPGGGQSGDPNDQPDNLLLPSATTCGSGAGGALVGVAGFLGLLTAIGRERRWRFFATR